MLSCSYSILVSIVAVLQNSARLPTGVQLPDLDVQCARLESYSQIKDELRDLKSKLNKEIKTNEKIQKKKDKKESLDNLKVPPVPFECSLCDVKLESLLKLKSHYKLCHMKASFTQTLETVLEDKSITQNKIYFF